MPRPALPYWHLKTVIETICRSELLFQSFAKARRTPDFLLRGLSHGRVCGFLIRNKFSIKPPSVFGTAGSTTKRRVPHPLRFLQRVGYATVGIGIRGIPPFAKNAKDGAPGALLHFLPRTRNAPFHIPRVGYAGGRLIRNKFSIKPRSVFGAAESNTKRRASGTRPQLTSRLPHSFWRKRGYPPTSMVFG
jgi:hypothetical protein